ncbi:MAG TPA: PAS domain S-box protein [Candidatus Competibacteraceae bacterium]|nr:PAS domain S-box protein [Candidatus Competibacter sp.]HRY18731.1 PAS domain S-box protein [Candidatus Competibacteraceae bacterium]
MAFDEIPIGLMALMGVMALCIMALVLLFIHQRRQWRASLVQHRRQYEHLAMQERVATIAATVPGLICSFRKRANGDMGMPYASPALVDLYGLRPEDVMEDASPIFAGIHPDDRLQVQARIAASARDMMPWQDEFRFQHPIKGEIWIGGRSLPQREPDDSVLWHGYMEDITERKKIEKLLRENSGFLNTLLNAIPIPIFYKDTEGRYLGFNRAFEKFFGQTQDYLIGKRVFDVAPPDIASLYHAKDIELLTHKDGIQIYESQVKDTSGALHDVVFHKATFKNTDGDLLGLIGGILDITKRKQIEQALLESEARYRTLFDNMAEGFAFHEIVTDEQDNPCDYRFLDINPAFERLTGLKRNYILNRRVREILPNVESYWIENYGQVALTGQPAHFENFAASLNRWYSVYAYSPAPRRFAVIVIDITESHRSQEQLRKLSLAVEQNPNSIVITDLHARIEYVNHAFCRTSGYRREEVLGKDPHILQSGHTPASIYAEMWQTLKKGKTWRGEFVNQHKNGHLYVEFVQITPVYQPDGHLTHYLAIKEDITERKRIGQELDRYRHHLEELVTERTNQLEKLNQELQRRTNQAEAANRAKSAFLANMSHEIRTPLNAILGFTHILLERIVEPQPLELLHRIANATQHLSSVINDILDLSKIEAGKLVLHPDDFDLASLFDHVLMQIRERAAAKGLKVTYRIDPALPGALHGDALRLRQVLLNFASNAVKFTEQGAITLCAGLIEDGPDEVLARFEVRDTGIGIAPEFQQQIFKAFEQVDGSTTRKFGGTGLGLTISQGLTEMMGGQIGVDSQCEVGSTFWFSARLGKCRHALASTGSTCAEANHSARHTPPFSEAEQVIARNYPGARLLLAEDHFIDREVAGALLKRAGLAVDVAVNGAEAVERAQQTDYALILMDVQMPVLDGFEATRAIRRLPNRPSTPILALTASAFAEDRWRCLEAGMDDHIAKPVDPVTLFTILLKWLSARRGTVGTAQPEDAAADPATVSGHVTPPPDVNWTQLRDVTTRLQELLTEDDMRVHQVFQDAAPVLHVVFGEKAQLLEQQIGDVQYRQALNTLRAALAESAKQVH